MFRQTKQKRAYEDVVLQIENAILRGDLKAGDKLSNGRTLENDFKVSRGTLREAMRALEQKGLIFIKVGAQGGAIVSNLFTRPIIDRLDFLLQSDKISFEELSEFRQLIECEAAAKAARNATVTEIETLNRILDSMNESLKKDEFSITESIDQDRRFHLEMVKIAGNRVFEMMMATIYEAVNPYLPQSLLKERVTAEKNYRSLFKLLEAIRKREPEKARRHIKTHVKRFWPKPRS